MAALRLEGPIYARIATDLRERIGNGDWGLGHQVPTEDELCRRYSVSRMTVRHAIDRLVAAGLLVRRQGVGTFVASTKVERVASRLLGFAEDAVAHGLQPATQVLGRGYETAGEEDAELLRVDPEAQVYRVRRLRFTEGEAIGLNTVVVGPAFSAQLEDIDYLSSFYEGVAKAIGVEVSHADQTIEAALPDPKTASLLGLHGEAAMLRVTRVTYLADGRLVGLTRTLYRGDRYYLSLSIRRAEPD